LKPLIGITTYLTPARWGYWDLDAALVPADYVRAVDRAGGRPLLVPPAGDAVAETLAPLGGLVLSGGSDLDPSLYGAEAHPETFGVCPDRDRAELALLQEALARDLPVLGICRGSQVLNVARGGDLQQHLPEPLGGEHKHDPPGVFIEHGVTVEPGTKLAEITGGELSVQSHHHQGFGRLGQGLVATAYADDGTVEALEDPSRPFAIGVLWHPEAGERLELFEALVAAARRYDESRR